MKNRVLLESYFLPGDLEHQIGALVDQANDTIFGLASYFYAKGLSRVWEVAEALEYGMVGVNTSLISTEVAPFGGVKKSGQGREGSKFGTEVYLEMKYICMGGIAGSQKRSL